MFVPLRTRQLLAMFVFIHVLCNPLPVTAETPVLGKVTTFALISCLWGGGLFGASSFTSLTRDVWNVRQNQIAPRNLLQASASQPRTALFRQALMTANFCSADFLSRAQGLDKVHRGTVAPRPRFCPLLTFLFSCSRHLNLHRSYFPPTDQLLCPMCGQGVI